MDMCRRCAQGLAQQAQTSWAHLSCPAGSCRQRSAVPPASRIFLGFLVLRQSSLRPTALGLHEAPSSSKNGKSWCGSPLTLDTLASGLPSTERPMTRVRSSSSELSSSAILLRNAAMRVSNKLLGAASAAE